MNKVDQWYRKRCLFCNKVKHHTEFNPDENSEDRFNVYCKLCQVKPKKELKKKRRQKIRPIVTEDYHKECACCRKTKHNKEFNKVHTNIDGFSSYCKPCLSILNKAYKAKLNQIRQDKKEQKLKEIKVSLLFDLAKECGYKLIKEGYNENEKI